MLLSLSLLGFRLSSATTAASLGAFLDPNGFLNASETSSTAWAGAGIDTGTTGPKGTAQTFRIVVPTQTEPYLGRILLRIPWTLTTQAPAGCQGTIQASATITPGGGGTPVTIPATLGGVRNLNSANGTTFVEIIALDMPAFVLLTPGTTIDITVQPNVTTAAAGATLVPTLRHNPAVLADQLVAELQLAQGVS